MLRSCLAVCMIAVAVGSDFMLIAPKVVRYDVQESVIITVTSNQPQSNVVVYVTDYPDKLHNYTVKTMPNIQNNEPLLIPVTIHYDLDTDYEKLTGQKLAYVVARVDAKTKQTVVRLSENVVNVFLQTDKPIYTPSQNVHISLYTTDFNNERKHTLLRLDIQTPTDIIVQRIDLNNRHTFEGEAIDGFHKQQFHIEEYAMLGEWSIIVHYGPVVNNVGRFSRNSTAKFKVDSFVLPTFSCEIVPEKEYIVGRDTTLSGRVNAKYTFDKDVMGTVNVHFGIENNGQIVYGPIDQGGQLYKGGYDFHFDLNRLYTINPFDTLIGKRLAILAECYEGSSGHTVSDTQQTISFAHTPLVFDFSSTRNYFKPGLPLLIQFDVKFASGRIAAMQQITFTYGNKPETRQVETSEGGTAHHTTVIRTDVTNTLTFTFKATVNGVETIASHTVTPQINTNDVSLKLKKITYNAGEHASLEVHRKGANIAFVYFVIISKGQIIHIKKVSTTPADGATYTDELVEITASMVPAARFVVFYTNGNVQIGDSLSIEVLDVCANKHSIKAKPDSYTFTNNKDIHAKLEIDANVNSFLHVEMLDKAVLAVNDAIHLTPDRIKHQLLTLDSGSGAGDANNMTMMFERSGLAMAGPGGLVTHVPRSLGRHRRSTRERTEILPDDECCRRGTIASRNCVNTAFQFAMQWLPTQQCLDLFNACCRNVTTIAPRPAGNVMSLGVERSSGTGAKHDFIVKLGAAQIRSNFPQSRSFALKKIRQPNGKATIEFQLPDSITTWSVQAVELNENKMMCVYQPTEFSVIKSVFLNVHIPFRVVKGETVLIEATAFNNNEINIPVTFYMAHVKDICSNAEIGEYTDPIDASIPEYGTVTVSWPIVPLQIGTFTIPVFVMNVDKVEDVIEKTLVVVPEGEEDVKNTGFMVDVESDNWPEHCNKEDEKCDVRIELPDDYVPGSARGVISLEGNMFGAAIDIVVTGIDGQLRMPRGCGEQVMIYTAPGVYAYEYMRMTNSLSPKADDTFPKVVRSGVNQILGYRKNDDNLPTFGGIGVWVNTPPSTWLTAFVLKVFANALTQGGPVDQNLLNTCVDFIYEQQQTGANNNGRFNEYSAVARHHGSMIGAVSKDDNSLTAFVIIALMESGFTQGVNRAKYEQAISYLASKVNASKTPYEKALVAYALSKSSHNGNAYHTLKQTAEHQVQADMRTRYFPGPAGTSKKIHVETAAYAILAALNNNDVDYCYDIVVWLHQKRRNGGIWQSTQDTVVALQALARYAVTHKDRVTRLDITIVDARNDMLNHQEITDKDKNRRFSSKFDPEDKKKWSTVGFRISGEGVVQVNVDVFYNTLRTDGLTCDAFQWNIRKAIELVENLENNDVNRARGARRTPGQGPAGPKRRLNVRVCARHLGSGPTEMAIMEIGILTGYQADDSVLKDMVAREEISSYEVSERMVAIYLDSISNETEICVQIVTNSETAADNLSPVPVKIYDYYNRETECIDYYSDQSAWELDFEGDKCYAEACSRCYGKNGESVWTLQDFKDVYCTPDVSYVIKTKFKSMHNSTNWTYYTMDVTEVFKGGALHLINSTVELAKRFRCGCPDLDFLANNEKKRQKKEYLILGKVEKEEKTGDVIINSLLMDDNAYVEDWKRRKPRSDRTEIENCLREPCTQ